MGAAVPRTPTLRLNRRDFLLLTSGIAVITGCQSEGDGGSSTAPAVERVVNAGPVALYAADGVYTGFQADGFFIVRRGEKLMALSSICTHKKCKLAAERDRSFYCKCHGSKFDPDGKVLNGPAKRDLPEWRTFVDDAGQLRVSVLGR